jgi:hypothetical protein
MADPPTLMIDLLHDELSGKYEKLKHKYMKEIHPTPAFTMNPPVMNQHDAPHDEMNALYLQVLRRFLCIPVHHLLFHPMAPVYTNL